MNKFEKYCWNKGIKNTLFGNVFLLNQSFFQLIKSVIPFKWLRIKKQPRVQQFMGIYRYEES